MTSDSEVIRVGTDSSGRPILMTRYMKMWWDGVCERLSFTPVVIQGAWMSRVTGGGAADSSGFHDFGGCLDIRTRDLTSAQVESLNRVVREGGAGGWARFDVQGFDPHYHLVLGSDPGIGPEAAQQYRNYIAGDAGLAGTAADYEWRPSPLVTTPPADYMEEAMKPEDFAQIRQIVREEIDSQFSEKVEVTTTSGTRRISYTQLLREVWQKINKNT